MWTWLLMNAIWGGSISKLDGVLFWPSPLKQYIMKTIIFRSWMIGLSFMMLFLLTIQSCSNLYKLKTSDLHQEESRQESTVVLQESNIKSLHTIGNVFQNDSSTYWIWFQSNNPFLFHPDKGLEAEQGNLIVGGSRLQSNLEQENTILLSNSHKDSSSFEKLKVKEKNLVKVLEKERKGGNWLWLWLLGGGWLVWVFTRKGR